MRQLLSRTTLMLACRIIIPLVIAGLLATSAKQYYGSFGAALAKLRGNDFYAPKAMDLGAVSAGTPQELQVPITLTSNQEMKLLGFATSCTCTVVNETFPLVLRTGETKRIKIRINVPGGHSVFRQTLSFYTSSRIQNELPVQIVATVRPG